MAQKKNGGLGCGCFSLIILFLIGILLFPIFIMGLVTTTTTNPVIYFNIHENYIENSYKYAKEIEKLKERESEKEDGKEIEAVDFIELFTYAIIKTDDPHKYKSNILKDAYDKVEDEKDILDEPEIKNEFKPYKTMFDAVLNGIIGDYEIKRERSYTDRYGNTITEVEWEEEEGVRAFFPFPQGYHYTHADDFGNDRNFEDITYHEGNDLLASEGTPIVNIESGYIEKVGWNRAGGWRLGIRSLDGNRYFYYAHMQKYAQDFEEGKKVEAGEVIGFVGDTGYGDRGTSGRFPPHLHLHIEVTYDIDGKEEKMYIDPYHFLKFLEEYKVNVTSIIDDDGDRSYVSSPEIRVE